MLIPRINLIIGDRMANISTKIANSLTKHGIDLMRIDAGLRRKIIRMINGLEDAIVQNIKRFDPSAPAQLKFKNQRMEALFSGISEDSKQVYKDIYKEMQGDLIDLAKAESLQTAKTVNKALNIELMSGRINQNVLTAMVNGALVDGTQMRKLWKHTSDQLKFDVEAAMREGILNNETIPQLTQRIRGTRANNFKDGVMQTKRHQAARIVRTSAMTVANKARGMTYEQNSNVIKGIQWLSTLDSKTSDQCKALSNQAWTLEGEPIGDTTAPWPNFPPIHPNCRSTTLPILKSWEELSRTRDPRVRKVLKLHRPPKRVRASMDGAVSGDMSYEQWLSAKDKTNPKFVQGVLGPTKYELWKKGKLSFRDLIDQSHNPLTVQQLLKKVA